MGVKHYREMIFGNRFYEKYYRGMIFGNRKIIQEYVIFNNIIAYFTQKVVVYFLKYFISWYKRVLGANLLYPKGL